MAAAAAKCAARAERAPKSVQMQGQRIQRIKRDAAPIRRRRQWVRAGFGCREASDSKRGWQMVFWRRRTISKSPKDWMTQGVDLELLVPRPARPRTTHPQVALLALLEERYVPRIPAWPALAFATQIRRVEQPLGWVPQASSNWISRRRSSKSSRHP